MKYMVMYQYPTCDMHFVQRKDVLISEISFGILYIFKRPNVLQMFLFNLIESKVRLLTNKQEFLTFLHLRSFRQFSEETRSAENLIEFSVPRGNSKQQK